MSEVNALEEGDDHVDKGSRASYSSAKMDEVVPEGFGLIKWPSGE